MYTDYLTKMFSSWPWYVLVSLIIWSLIWKGWALWKSAKAGSKPWFIVILIVNTFGVLEILYIYVFSQKKYGQKEERETHVQS